MPDERVVTAETAKRIAGFIAPFRVGSGSTVRLAKDFDPNDPSCLWQFTATG